MIFRRPLVHFTRYFEAIRGSLLLISKNNVSLTSAGVAFFSMLSLFPALAALIALLGLISDPVFVIAQLEEVRGLLPDDVYDIINAQVVGLVTTQTETLGWAGLLSVLVALWSARAGVAAMIIGLNSVYGVPNRGMFRYYLTALFLTFLLVAVVIVAVISLIVTPVVLAFFPLGFVGMLLVDSVRWIVAVGVLLIGIVLAQTAEQIACDGCRRGHWWRCHLGSCCRSVFRIMSPILGTTIRSTVLLVR